MEAIRNPDENYESLLWILKHNIEFGSYTLFPCDCCKCEEVTEQETIELNIKIEKDLEGIK